MTFLEDTTYSEPVRVAFQSFGNGPGVYIMSDQTMVQETDDEFAIRRGFVDLGDGLMYMRSDLPKTHKPSYVLEYDCEEIGGIFTPLSHVEYYK